MLDLRVWAALRALLREQLPEPPADDPTLANEDRRTSETTGYQLAEMVRAAAGGDKYRKLRAALVWRRPERACGMSSLIPNWRH